MGCGCAIKLQLMTVSYSGTKEERELLSLPLSIKYAPDPNNHFTLLFMPILYVP